MSVSTKFKADSSYSLGVMVPKVIFSPFALRDTKIQDGHLCRDSVLGWTDEQMVRQMDSAITQLARWVYKNDNDRHPMDVLK